MIDMFRKKPVLQYESAIKVYPNIITPAKNHVPEWYKKILKWKNNKIYSIEDGFHNSVKHCMPFFDSLSIGYLITLPYDLYVTVEQDHPVIAWPQKVKNPPHLRTSIVDYSLVPENHFLLEFTWDLSVSFNVPKGYSMLITHPLNRNDLPFTTVSGVIDGGHTIYPHGNFPFYLKKGFEGIIKQGTPVAQIIPFYQEGWKLKNKKGLVEIALRNSEKSGLIIYGWYKKTFWTRKKYD